MTEEICDCGWEGAYRRDMREQRRDFEEVNDQLDDALDLLTDMVTHWDDGAVDVAAWFTGLEQLISVRARALTSEVE